MDVIKISDTQMQVETSIPAKTERTVYGRAMVEDKISLIQKEIATKEAELKECTDILAEMDKLGILSKT
jgi:uncharacterized small protein (DUF1192 family)